MTPEKKVGIQTAEERAKFMALQIIKFAEAGERGKKTLTQFILDEIKEAEQSAYERGFNEAMRKAYDVVECGCCLLKLDAIQLEVDK